MPFPKHTPADMDALARAVLGVFQELARRSLPGGNPPPALLWSAEYEYFVEKPRRRGVDPVWQSMLAEALAQADRAAERAA